MKNLVTVVVVLGFVSYTHTSEENNHTEPLNIKKTSDSTDEQHSETLHLPTYVVADSGPPADTPVQYLPLQPETPVYSSVYTGKSSSPYLRQGDVANNYIDHEYNSILGLTQNIPGIPGRDYPLYASVPYTGFSCHKMASPGFYADVLADCQVWHYCQPDGRHDAFLCPNGTIFDQKNRVCNWWYNVQCQDSQYWYAINDDLYRSPKKKYVPDQYYDHYYAPSKVIETKTKPLGTEKPLVIKPIKFHPAVIVKIPKKTYQNLGNEKLQQATSGITSETLLFPKGTRIKSAASKSNLKV